MPFKMHKIIFFKKKKIIRKKCLSTGTLPKIFRPVTQNTFIFSSPELKAHWWANIIPVTPASGVRPSSVIRQHFQTSSSLKLLGQLNSYFIWRLLRMGERKFVQMVLVTWPRWPPRPYMVKTLKKSSSPEPESQWPWDLVCSIGVVEPTKFVQMMILGWPWPT